MKKNIFFIVLIFSLSQLSAQIKDNMSLGFDLGFPLAKASNNLGFFVNLEPQLKVSKQVYLGMRIAMSINSQTLNNQDSTQFTFDEEFDHGFFSVVPVVDYFWQKERYSPYIGLGLGVYSLANYLDVFRINASNSEDEVFEVQVSNQFGFLMRGGFEYGKARFGLEYNLVPKVSIESPIESKKVGTVNSSYLGLSFGLVIGS